MEDEGVVIDISPYGNTSLIVRIFSKKRGKISSFLKGGAAKGRQRISVGSHIVFKTVKRLEEHMGMLKFETIKEFALFCIKDKKKNFLLSCICEILFFFSADEAEEPEVYEKAIKIIYLTETEALFEEILKEYILFELDVLKYSGFGIDTSECALTGAKENLFFLSPFTGKGATLEAGLPFRERLFIIPKIFGNMKGSLNETSDMKAAFKITTHFLSKLPGFEKLLTRSLLLSACNLKDRKE